MVPALPLVASTSSVEETFYNLSISQKKFEKRNLERPTVYVWVTKPINDSHELSCFLVKHRI